MGMFPALTGISFLTALALTFALAMLWELYEKLIGIRETVPNILLDVVLSIAACVLTSYALLAYPLHPDDLLVVAVAVLALYTFTNLSGWFAYRRRNRDFTR
ncbi:MAG: hypothetical protein UY89_C0020G0010 [Parcubacteria group bacterium GW2011_GWA1_54_9]|nr:MAG: hypothetical protein UY89_C0020G0010 [Parcubacteria group bacterium GW2011_GWA1_54_9]